MHLAFEGTVYSLPRPSIFVVHGPGRPIDFTNGITSSMQSAGVAAREWEFSSGSDLVYWEYEKGDFSLRLDTEAGPLEQILLAAAIRGADMARPKRREFGRPKRRQSQRGQRQRRECERSQCQRSESERREPSQPLSGGAPDPARRPARRLEHDASPSWRAPDHLARRRVLAPLAEAEPQIEKPRRIAVHDVERHVLPERIRALKQLLDELRADSLSAHFPRRDEAAAGACGRRSRPPESSRFVLSPTQMICAGARL